MLIPPEPPTTQPPEILDYAKGVTDEEYREFWNKRAQYHQDHLDYSDKQVEYFTAKINQKENNND